MMIQDTFSIDAETSVCVLDSDPNREFVMLFHRGTENVLLKFKEPHYENEGIILKPDQLWEPPSLIKESIYLISTSGTQDIYVCAKNRSE